MGQWVKFSEAGKWAENDTAIPQFEVAEGDEREVSLELADIIVKAKKGKRINAPKPPKEDKAKGSKSNPAKEDKANAESK